MSLHSCWNQLAPADKSNDAHRVSRGTFVRGISMSSKFAHGTVGAHRELEISITNLQAQLKSQHESIVEAQSVRNKLHDEIMLLQSQNLQLTAIVQNHGRFLRGDEETRNPDQNWDILAPENSEDLESTVLAILRSKVWVSVTAKMEGVDDE